MSFCKADGLAILGVAPLAPATLVEIKPPVKNDTEPLIAELADLFKNGQYDELISLATPALKDEKTSDPRVFYWRGRAAYFIGFFGMASHDLALAGDYLPLPQSPSASLILRKIGNLKELAPHLIHEIRSGNKVVFRVYYDDADAWTAGIIALLPQAYAINSAMMGKTLMETPVFIFRDFSRFRAFEMEYGNGTPPGSWCWAAGNIGAFFFCENNLNNLNNQNLASSYMRGTVVHEYNHCLVSRLICHADIPSWFNEGLAMRTEPSIAPDRGATFDRWMQESTDANAFVSLADLQNYGGFNTVCELHENQGGASDPYAQSYAMTNYLITLLDGNGLLPFLETIRQTRSFETALQQHVHLSSEQFYEQWLRQAKAL